MSFENLVVQMLVTNKHKLYFYTRYNKKLHRNDIEIDFLLTTGNKISQKLIPIEVKSSKNYKTTSLDKFNEIFKSRVDFSYIIHPKNLVIKENNIIAIPIYMIFCL